MQMSSSAFDSGVRVVTPFSPIRPGEGVRRGLLSAATLVLAAVSTGAGLAQDAIAQFYRGRQITVIVGSSAGGGYDIYARLLARHMPKHIPGHPVMTVTNMPGAGSNAAAAHVYTVAPKDGTVIGALQNSAVLDALLEHCSATPGACATTPRNLSISVPPRWTITSASLAPMRR